MLIVLNTNEEKYFNEEDYQVSLFPEYLLITGKGRRILFPFSSILFASLPDYEATQAVDIKKIR